MTTSLFGDNRDPKICTQCGGARWSKQQVPGKCQFCYRRHQNGKRLEIERMEKAGARLVFGRCSMLSENGQ